MSDAYAKSDYSSGMSAYMDGDYELAQQHWLQAAESGDARAMFNLGLLQERSMVTAASPAKADEWFARSGESGYAPADYHLALRLQQAGNESASQALMQRAADNGYVLAKEKIQQPVVGRSEVSSSNPVNPSSLTPTTIKPTAPTDVASTSRTRTLSADNAAPTQLNSGDRYNRESWVLQQSPESWTIQLLAFSDEAKVRNFIDDHGLHRGAAYIAEGDVTEPIYKLFYGAFATKEQADKARSGFTTALKEHGPWLRQIKAIQASINRP